MFISVAVAQSPVANKKAAQQKPVMAKVSQPIDFFSRKKMDLVKELDDIMREMIWLIRTQRPTANRTLFGKVYRALQQAKGAKLTEKSKHTCDQYTLEKVSAYQFRVYEHCQKHRAPDLLVKIDWSQNQINFQFSGQNYADVLGLAAALVAPVVDCIVTIDNEEKLKEFKCTGFRITRGDQVARFESLGYKKDRSPMMVMKGEVLKDLLPFSDLTISVPLTGKVKILEKKKTPDMDETTPEQKAKEKRKQVEQSQPIKALPPYPVAQPIPEAVDPRNPDAPPSGQSPNQSPRGSEVDSDRSIENPDPNAPPIGAPRPNPNNDLRKNSDPDVIELNEPPRTR